MSDKDNPFDYINKKLAEALKSEESVEFKDEFNPTVISRLHLLLLTLSFD